MAPLPAMPLVPPPTLAPPESPPLAPNKQYKSLVTDAVQLASRGERSAASSKLRSFAGAQEAPKEVWARRAAEQMLEAGYCWLRCAHVEASPLDKAEKVRWGKGCMRMARSLHGGVVDRHSDTEVAP